MLIYYKLYLISLKAFRLFFNLKKGENVEKLFFSLSEVAKIIGLCRRTVDRYVKAGLINTVRIGSTVRITKAELDRLATTGTTMPSITIPPILESVDILIPQQPSINKNVDNNQLTKPLITLDEDISSFYLEPTQHRLSRKERRLLRKQKRKN